MIPVAPFDLGAQPTNGNLGEIARRLEVLGGYLVAYLNLDAVIRIIRRSADGQELEFRFDYDAYIKGKAPGTNIVLHNGDTIIVPE